MNSNLTFLFALTISLILLSFSQSYSKENIIKRHGFRGHKKTHVISNTSNNSIDSNRARQNAELIEDRQSIRLLTDENKYLRKAIDDSKATVDYTKYIAIVVSIIALIGSVFQYNNAQRSLRANVTVNLLSEFRNEKWDGVRTLISLKKETATFEEIKHYSQLINHFGYLLERKYVSSDALFDMMGTGVIRFWKFYSEQIFEQRILRENEFYQYHVEYLHARMKAIEFKRTKHINSLLKKSRLV